MKPTTSCAARAVRMYVPMRPVATTWSSTFTSASTNAAAAANTAAAGEGPTSKEVGTAKRLTEAILRSRNSHKKPSLQQDQTLSTILPPLHPKNVSSSILVDDADRHADPTTTSTSTTALQLALSFGKSALLTHLAHQHHNASVPRPYAHSAVDWARTNGEVAEEANNAAVSSPSTSTPAAFRSHTSALRPFSAEDGVAALTLEAEETWAKLDNDMKIRWITSTSQGRRALRQVREVAGVVCVSAPAVGLSLNSNGAPVRRVPSLREMLLKYPDTLVQPRHPRPAALSPAPKEHHLRKLFAGETKGTEEERDKAPSAWRGEVHLPSTTPGSRNRISLHRRVDAARTMEREKVWFRSLSGCLGGDNAAKFVNDVKSLQRPREESGEYGVRAAVGNSNNDVSGNRGTLGGAFPLSKSKEAHDAASVHRGGSQPVYSIGLLNLCEELGIGSPRRAYVRSRVLQAVDDADTTAHPLTLDQVRELTTKYGAQYDKDVDAVAATAHASGTVSPAQAVRDFEKHQLELAVNKVQVKLTKFQEDVPLLRNCTNVFHK